ncbi:amidohydrolase family protein [Iamia sp. SCSIO 61187]|uniref:amidohydrolase family protein n=1 Tax=Iamia sp. SCSIO 61187 TaxID=2722752 RepID=UPI001C63B5EB|nr:amidohydrolase family protein [Iamia sp. SCSIO 61187]QYG93158.1 amidohydrolase family protein [Iamia sp. SCSIO 61187]
MTPPTPVVDAHVHLLPGRLGEKVRDFFLQGFTADELYPLDHRAILDRLAGEGVEEVWHLPYVHKPGIAGGVNEASAATAAAAVGGPVRVVPGASVHPADDDPLALVRTAVEDLGARVLKLHCSVGDHDADDPRLDAVWAYAAEVRLPVVVHVGHAVSGQTDGAELAPVGRVATRHPDAVVVLAHCAHPATEAAVALMDAHPQVHADLTPVVRSPVVLTGAVAERLADRLLLGSDAPNTPITSARCRAAVAALDLSPAAEAAITGGTARRLQAQIRA